MRRRMSSNSGEMLKSIIGSLKRFRLRRKRADCSRNETHSPATNANATITAPALFSSNSQHQDVSGWERCLLRSTVSLEDLIDEPICTPLPTADCGCARSHWIGFLAKDVLPLAGLQHRVRHYLSHGVLWVRTSALQRRGPDAAARVRLCRFGNRRAGKLLPHVWPRVWAVALRRVRASDNSGTCDSHHCVADARSARAVWAPTIAWLHDILCWYDDLQPVGLL